MHEADGVARHEIAHLAGDGGEVGGLDFDDEVAVEDVDDVAVEADLNAAAGLEVALSQRGVEVAFVERADRCADAV